MSQTQECNGTTDEQKSKTSTAYKESKDELPRHHRHMCVYPSDIYALSCPQSLDLALALDKGVILLLVRHRW